MDNFLQEKAEKLAKAKAIAEKEPDWSIRDAQKAAGLGGVETGNEGLKFDTGKPPVWSGFINYFPNAIAAVSLISLFGVEKYKEWGGWKKVPDAIRRYSDAFARHQCDEATKAPLLGQDERLLELVSQIVPDPKPELIHAIQSAWNAMARVELLIAEAKGE